MNTHKRWVPFKGVVERKHKPISGRVNLDISVYLYRIEGFSETNKN